MSANKFKNIVIIGGGGHASVLADILSKRNYKVRAVVTKESSGMGGWLEKTPALTDEEFISTISTNTVNLVNGIGQLPHSRLREEIYLKYTELGYTFLNVISEDSHISPSSTISDGVQIMPRVVVQPNVFLGCNTIINTGSIVEHDTVIAKNCHIAPGVVICGGVSIGASTCIGAGATIIQGVTIGDRCIVGAGCIITKNIKAGQICYPPRYHVADIKHRSF